MQPIAIDAHHAIRRGGFAALVFCGRADALAELAGEPTAHTGCKFVMNDDALGAQEDFARSSGATLPRWPGDRVEPIGGVCFIFTGADHPTLALLQSHGGLAGEHYVITTGLSDQSDAADLAGALRTFLEGVPADGPIAILGYGHQGRRIAQCLTERLNVARSRLLVHDANADSRAGAERDALAATADDRALDAAAAVIASPLDEYPAIAALLRRAAAANICVFDNARARANLRHFQMRGRVGLDEAAARALRTDADASRLRCADPVLQRLLSAHIVREDDRILAGRSIPHIISGQRHPFENGESIDLGRRWVGDGLAPETFGGHRRAFVSLQGRADLGLFAARELAFDLWPAATQLIMPSSHAGDLGATQFERLLRDHLDAREIVSTMQTPAQRVILGVAAAHAARQRAIIEIGSALGGSALLMAAATTGGNLPAAACEIISIDPDAATRDIMRFAFARHGCAARLRQIVCGSDEAIAQLADLQGGCGLVFIDGLHAAAAVARDIRNYAPLVTRGGLLLLHDVCPAIHSVMQAAISEALADQRFRALCLVDGLLVLERVA